MLWETIASINDRKMNEMKDGQNTFNAGSSPVSNACKNIKGGLVLLCSESINSQERALCVASVKHCYGCGFMELIPSRHWQTKNTVMKSDLSFH